MLQNLLENNTCLPFALECHAGFSHLAQDIWADISIDVNIYTAYIIDTQG